jgi:hypothetical protein
MAAMKTLSQLRKDKRIKCISDERNNEDGIFIYLKPEYRDFDFDPSEPAGLIHEQTIEALNERMEDVKHI